ncbi:MAG: tetratricopeptide repeat protein [Rhodospirillales bacterium]|nr:MAG: tetratricopeptide repeat protein [Rhodospirillales bacterium]
MRLFKTARPADRIPDPASRIIAVILAAILFGCSGGNRGDAAPSDAVSEESRQLDMIEPRDQRSQYGNYLAGRFAEKQRDFERASSSLARALEENPDDPALLRRTFFLALEAGRMDLAIQLARQLDAAGTRISPVQLLLAAESVKKSEFQAAIERLETMDRDDLARYLVPLALAWAYVGAGEFDTGLAALSPLNTEDGFALLRRMHEGLINDVAGRADDADAAYRAAMGTESGAAPNRVVRAYGNYLERRGRADEARALYETYGGIEADSPIIVESAKRVAGNGVPDPLVGDAAQGMAEGLFDIASVLPIDRAGDFVLIYARMALYLRPDFPLGQLLIGDVFDQFGRYEEAAAAYRSVDPDSAYGWVARLRLADDLYDLGDADAAIALLREMSRDQPERSDALIRLGNVLRYEERYDESVAAYDGAIERVGKIGRNDWTLLYSRGIALERAGLWERAERDFLQALELQPGQPFVLNYLGYSWVEQGKNLDEARQMLVRAVAQRPDDGYIVDSMGWALYKLDDFAEAVTYLERAVALRPQDPVINDHLGDAYWRVGRIGEARIQWRRVLGLEPEDDLRRQIEQKLKDGLPPPGGRGGG